MDKEKIFQHSKEESDKRLLKVEGILALSSTLLFLIIISLATYLIYYLDVLVFPIIMFCLGFIILIFNLLICVYIEQKAGFYICTKCKNKYIPTYNQVLFSPHINRTRYMKCPYCQKRSWQRKVIK